MARAWAFDPSHHLVKSLDKAFGPARVKLTGLPSPSRFRAKLKDERPDFVVLDVSLPKAGGFDLLGIIREEFPDLPVVLVTAKDAVTAGPMEPALKDANVDFVVVPWSADEVVTRVRRLLAQPRTARTVPVAALEHLVPELHHRASGRLDAKRVAELFGLPLAALARALRREPATVHKTPDAPSLQPGLRPLERVAAALFRLVGSADALRMWLNAANRQLEDQPPLALIERGQAEVVAELLEDVLHGQPG